MPFPKGIARGGFGLWETRSRTPPVTASCPAALAPGEETPFIREYLSAALAGRRSPDQEPSTIRALGSRFAFDAVGECTKVLPRPVPSLRC
jgi:hypothetical protein